MPVVLSAGERAPEGHPGGGAEAESHFPGGEFNSTEGETQTPAGSPGVSLLRGDDCFPF